MNAQTPNACDQALVLFAHGSRDPLWAKPIEAVAQAMHLQLGDQALVRCAYLELTTPSLPEVVAELSTGGVIQVRVLPMFLGMGRHAREDLPQLMNEVIAQYPHIHFDMLPSVGENPEVIQALALASLRNLTF